MSDSEEFSFDGDNMDSTPRKVPRMNGRSSTNAASSTFNRRRSKVVSYNEDASHDEDDEDYEFEETVIPKKKKNSVKSKSTPTHQKKEKKRVRSVTPNSSSSKKAKTSSSSSKKAKTSRSSSKKAKTSSSSTKKKKSKKSIDVSDDEDEFERPPPRKTPKKAATPTEKKLKELDKPERLNHAMRAFLWWESEEPPAGCQWRTMEHAGVSFPEPYEPHGVKMKYKGQDVDLTPVEEEAATFFAAMDPEGMHLGNPKTSKIFTDNFFSDFKSILGRKHTIQKFEHCDFGPIRDHLNTQKLVKKAITDEQKQQNKSMKNEVLYKFGYALVDGHLERVGNYNMEPPGAFRGRGEHPKMGKLKQRVLPEQVSINTSESVCVPVCPVAGHAWGDVRHDPCVQWLAQWKENINNQDKYMQLAAQSSFKGKSDRSKYNKAALLCENIDKIRASYKKKLTSKSSEERQLATAMWVIDRLALRVGGEKDTEEEADTVGCCSLRVEHLLFDPNEEGGDNKEIELEFLGKDSMLYKQTIDFGATMYNENNGMGEQVYKNFQTLCKRKKDSEQVFDSLTPTTLNAHLKSIMDGLTAKVFRTYNASKTLQDELLVVEESKSWSKLSPQEKVIEYNNANRQVAILCNHQKSVSKAQETQLENITNKINALKRQKSVLKKILATLSGKKGGYKSEKDIPLKKPEKTMVENAQKAVLKAKSLKEKAVTNEEKIAATQADEKAKQMRREAADAKFTQAHLWDKIPTVDMCCKRITMWTGKIQKMELDLRHKDDNKEVSLGTSKINYMDPRISVAWCKRNEVPIEKVFSKTLRDKFNWAMAVPPDWQFNADVVKQPHADVVISADFVKS